MAQSHVNRLLPSIKKRSVGPFVLLDHFGPEILSPESNVDILPHPHIGICTLTYLFDGHMIHRDSLGVVQEIICGEVNLMRAGKGIVHSERSLPNRKEDMKMHGIQFWLALPKDEQDIDPEFFHEASSALPQWSQNGLNFKLILGKAYDHSSPIHSLWPGFSFGNQNI